MDATIVCMILTVVFICVLLFNDTSTTEIYTYCHTRSLHDALPICSVRQHQGPSGPVPEPDHPGGLRAALGPEGAHGDLLRGRHQDFLRTRSEEHTSELQSLMRISYAVFCLKKKKKTPPLIPPSQPEHLYTNNIYISTITHNT